MLQVTDIIVELYQGADMPVDEETSIDPWTFLVLYIAEVSSSPLCRLAT